MGSGNQRHWDQTGACQWSLGSREEGGQRRMTRRDWRGVRASRPNSAVQGGCTGSQLAQRPGLGSLKLCTFPHYSDALWGVCAQLAFPRRHGRSRRILNSFDCPCTPGRVTGRRPDVRICCKFPTVPHMSSLLPQPHASHVTPACLTCSAWAPARNSPAAPSGCAALRRVGVQVSMQVSVPQCALCCVRCTACSV